MIVEFMGVPGTGKSTLIEAAKEIFGRSHLKAMSVHEVGPYCLEQMFLGRVICFVTPQKWQNQVLFTTFRRLIWLYRLKFILKNTFLSWVVVTSVIRRKLSWNDTRAILRWFFRDVSYYQFFQNRLRSDEVLILDEGVIQRTISLYALPFEEPDRLKIKQYVTQLPQADLAIWIEAPLDVCVARVIARGAKMRYRGQELNSFIVNSAKTLDIATQISKELGWEIIQVNNGASLEQGIANLCNKLGKRVYQRI